MSGAASDRTATAVSGGGRRLLLLIVLALVAVTLPAVAAPPPAHAAINPSMEADFVALANVERAKQGLPALRVRSDIRSVARDHSVRMADESRLHHNPNFSREITDWQVVAENVGRGPSVEALHRALMNSEGHRANILNERVTEIGVGVEVRSGTVWVTQNFRRPRGEVDPGTTSTTVFGDVSSTSVHRDSILAVAGRGIAESCGLARFCPSDSVSRADFVTMLGKALGIEPASSSRFTDVSGTTAGYAEALAERDIVSGTTATTFSPDRTLTREQFASLLARSLDLEPVASPFADVTSVHAGNVGALAARGVINGCSTTRFCPGDQVTRAQAAALLDREFGS